MDSAEYKAFRTGLTYRDVYSMLWSSSSDPAQWRYKRRNTVLGMWRQIKLEMYAEKERREDEAVANSAHVEEKQVRRARPRRRAHGRARISAAR